MKFRNYLESISGVSIYPVITLLIFFIFFTVLFVWVYRSRSKPHLNAIGQLPLNGGEIDFDPAQPR